MKPLQAAITGVTQVLPGIASSFATTLLVFGSLAFITGEIGQILRILPIVLIVVITVSLIEAFLILPSHLGHSLVHMHEREAEPFSVLRSNAVSPTSATTDSPPCWTRPSSTVT